MSRKRGFTLVEMMIVVALIGILTSIAIPNFIQARDASCRNACISNLTQLNSAIDMWNIDNGPGTPTFVQLEPYIRDVPTTCPLDNSAYVIVAGNPVTATCPNAGHAP